MSDPAAIQIPVQTGVTSDLLIGLKPSAPKSRSYRISVAPLNKSTFSPGDQCIIELPVSRRGTYFDQSQSFLKFTVQCGTTTAITAAGGSGVYLENTAYSFLQRLDVYNSSNLLETINNYGDLCNMLIDTSLSQSDKAALSPMIGSNFLTQPTTTQATYAQNNLLPIYMSAGDRGGLPLMTATSVSSATPYTFCLPLLSGVIGINSSKCIPVGALNSPLRLEFTLAANDDAIYYGTAGAGANWQISNVEFDVCYIELYDDILDAQFQPGVPQYISTSTYRQASTYLPSSTSGEFTTLLPFRCASLTSLYARFRNFSTATQGANATAAYRRSSSINPSLSSFYFRIGSSIYPNKMIYLNNGTTVGNGSEAFTELMKSFHALSSTLNNGSIQWNQYNVCATPRNAWIQNYVPASKATLSAFDTANNSFAIGLECQSFSNRNDTILSGISTLNSQIFFTAIVNSGDTAGGTNSYNYTADFYAQMDMILVILDGVMSAKF